MKKITPADIKNLHEYELARAAFRSRIIELKARRRVSVGPLVTLVFENRDTALFQIQEMLRTERITKGSAIDHEIETYNELVPGDDELSATVMIEIDDKDARERFLVDALGMEKRVYLAIDGQRVDATCDPARMHEDRLSAVMYLKFPLGKALADRVRAKGSAIELGVDHPAYTAKLLLPKALALELAEDLA